MKILFVGCGNMGGAIVSGMVKSQKFKSSEIIALIPQDEVAKSDLKQKYGIDVVHKMPDFKLDAIVFAVKPQTLDSIMNLYENIVSKDTLVISICAGKTLSYFQKYFPENDIVRTMPNLNSMVGFGSTVGVANKIIPTKEKELVESIFESNGSYAWVDDENLIDVVASISGSGPAYFFLFTELLAKAGNELGLSKELAEKLAAETFIGAAHTLDQSGKLPSVLRDAVTSKGGTTQAALEIFNGGDSLYTLVKKAAKSAIDKAKVLSK